MSNGASNPNLRFRSAAKMLASRNRSLDERQRPNQRLALGWQRTDPVYRRGQMHLVGTVVASRAIEAESDVSQGAVRQTLVSRHLHQPNHPRCAAGAPDGQVVVSHRPNLARQGKRPVIRGGVHGGDAAQRYVPYLWSYETSRHPTAPATLSRIYQEQLRRPEARVGHLSKTIVRPCSFKRDCRRPARPGRHDLRAGAGRAGRRCRS